MSSYSSKLRDPRWQRKRLEVLQYRDFECAVCSSKDKTLHVHHGYYDPQLDPWEYDKDTLHCVCEECHKILEEKLILFRAEIARISPEFFINLFGDKHEWREMVEEIRSALEVCGYVNKFGVHADAK